ncbi:MAG: hypothetical protein JST85_13430 [Acidobacteria bacterium]|nr:hypothetical protein [Acidobacteriota bacterium]
MTTQAKQISSPPGIPQSSVDISQEEMKLAIERVMASKHFAHAPMKQKFLRLICEFHLSGRGAELNEYLIGREVFNRDNSYNPAMDPIVRVGAHGVREKLERYYQKEGAKDEIRIEIPIGSYEPSFVRLPSQKLSFHAVANSFSEEFPEPEPNPLPAVSSFQTTQKGKLLRGYWLHLAAGICLILIALLAYFNIALQRQISAANEQKSKELELYLPIWQSFLQSADPTLAVLSNPPVFRFLNSADPSPVIKKSVPVSSEELNSIFEELPNKSILRIISNPRLTLTTDTYTGIGEAIGLSRVTDLLRNGGKSLAVKQSRTVSAEDLKNRNVIALGSVWVNNWSSNLPVKEEFVYTDQVTVLNLNPRQGEQAEYRASFDSESGRLIEDYALISVTPNISSRNVVMVLAGLHSEGTAAAAEYLTARQYLSEFNQQLIKAGSGTPPKHYQALLKVAVENGIPTFITLVTIHDLDSPAK